MTQARRRQVDRSTETQALLLHAAAALLQEVGFSGTTTALIARRAGVTTGALHHHFATKDELMLGVLDRMTERVLHRIRQQDHVTPDGRIDVPSLVAHLWEIYGDPEYWAIWEIIIGTRADPAFHEKVVAHRQETMQRVLPPWLERHVLSEARRPELAALFEFMLIAIRGLSLERFLDKDAAYFERNLALLAELVDRKLANLAGST
ncbi:TetR/AcrR family transcriptional regulator [Inquilinus limosus]|uniref:TetR/AcrR family transcriptional regulator n=1 Tax=Inquilinus limosus TaxID=171674 RepID=UPI00068D573F|nr:TetR/AcrR family transcriptional regulator [Inquilinus limosus]